MRSTIAHADDPRPLRPQFRACYAAGSVVPLAGNFEALRAKNAQPWRPACWHRPVEAWWHGDAPLGPPPVEERWPTFGPNRGGSARWSR